jgi:hypothetical protein
VPSPSGIKLIRGPLPLLAVCVACLTAPDDRPADVTIEIRTLQRSGPSLPFVPIGAVNAWHGTQRGELAASVTSDSAGLLVLHDTLSPLLGRLDSVAIYTWDPNVYCTSVSQANSVVHAPHLAWSIALPLDLTTSKLSAGEFCGFGTVPGLPNFGSGFAVHLQVDSITDSIRGVWQMVYQAPIATQAGTFTGTLRGTTVELQLASPPVPPCQPQYRLLIATASDSTLGLARLEPAGGCETVNPPPFRLVLFDSPDFP